MIGTIAAILLWICLTVILFLAIRIFFQAGSMKRTKAGSYERMMACIYDLRASAEKLKGRLTEKKIRKLLVLSECATASVQAVLINHLGEDEEETGL
jgi:hypothetical protein